MRNHIDKFLKAAAKNKDVPELLCTQLWMKIRTSAPFVCQVLACGHLEAEGTLIPYFSSNNFTLSY